MMLKGKNIIVTGANRGIGAAIVAKCAEEGANVWACARTKTDMFESMLANLEETFDVRCMPLYFDLTDSSAMKEAIKEIRSAKMLVSGLVNNAGMISEPSSFFMLNGDTLRCTMETNFIAPMLLTQYAARLMQRGGGGSIVNVSSVAALDGAPGQLDYVASKAAMVGATKELAFELANSGIRVNAVAPGVVNTEMGNSIEDSLMSATMARVSMRRLGETQDIANMVTFLLADAASFITGQIIRVDGGML